MDSVRVDGVEIPYRDTGGDGPVVVFVHGAFVTGAIWADVIAQLDGLRCVAPTWPLGGHTAAGPGADLRVGITSRRVLAFLRALHLNDVVLVANDTGTGLVLAALIDDTSRVSGLVLTNGDSDKHFPPAGFAPVVALCRRSPALGEKLLGFLSHGRGLAALLKVVTRRPVPAERIAESLGAFATSAETRREAVAVAASMHRSLTLAAGPAIARFDRPATVVWGGADRLLFPASQGRTLAAAFPHGELVAAPGSSTFVMIDAPELLAQAIRRTVAAAPHRPAPEPDLLTRDVQGRLTLDIAPTPRDD